MKTTKEKGDELEIVFEKFMKEKLDYSFTERNTFVNGKTAVRAYEVDIHGKKVNKNYQTLQQVGIAIAIFAIVEMFLGIVPEIDIFFEELFTSISPELAGFGLLIVGVIGAVAGYYGKQNSIEHT